MNRGHSMWITNIEVLNFRATVYCAHTVMFGNEMNFAFFLSPYTHDLQPCETSSWNLYLDALRNAARRSINPFLRLANRHLLLDNRRTRSRQPICLINRLNLQELPPKSVIGWWVLPIPCVRTFWINKRTNSLHIAFQAHFIRPRWPRIPHRSNGRGPFIT